MRLLLCLCLFCFFLIVLTQTKPQAPQQTRSALPIPSTETSGTCVSVLTHSMRLAIQFYRLTQAINLIELLLYQLLSLAFVMSLFYHITNQ